MCVMRMFVVDVVDVACVGVVLLPFDCCAVYDCDVADVEIVTSCEDAGVYVG